MGDNRRFEKTAEFIARHFPSPLRVADVAGGRGDLSNALSLLGYQPAVIDPRAKTHRQATRFRWVGSKFREEMSADFDLLVGLHPDGATEAICRCALSGKPVVIIPCCNHWGGIDSHGSPSIEETIRRFWRRGGVEWREFVLPFSGKNLAFMVKGA